MASPKNDDLLDSLVYIGASKYSGGWDTRTKEEKLMDLVTPPVKMEIGSIHGMNIINSEMLAKVEVA